MSTDTSEKGLETLVMRHMTGADGIGVGPNIAAEMRAPYGGTGYIAGSPMDYDRAHAIDVPQLFAFLLATQPDAYKKLAIAAASDSKNINRLKFLARLSGEIGKRGVIDVIRNGIEHGPLHFTLFYGTPSAGNAKATLLHAENRFSITRQFAYSMDETRRALDLGLFINGLPIATFELKNSLMALVNSVSASTSTTETGMLFDATGIDVCLVGSTSGGAASGCMLDLAWLVRELVKNGRMPLVSITSVLLHGTAHGRQLADMQDANTVSFLQELQHFSIPGAQRPGLCQRCLLPFAP